MSTAATIPDLPTSSSAPDPIVRAALMELLRMGMGVARVSFRLAEIEERGLDVLAEAADAAARGLMVAPGSMEAAMEAGRVADASDAARDIVVARIAAITVTYNCASRAVRRTAALIQRMDQPQREPAAKAAPEERERMRRAIARGMAAAMGDGADDAERLRVDVDAPEIDDEIGDRPAEAIIRDICRDLRLGQDHVAAPTPSAPVRTITQWPDRSRDRHDWAGPPPPCAAPDPDT